MSTFLALEDNKRAHKSPTKTFSNSSGAIQILIVQLGSLGIMDSRSSSWLENTFLENLTKMTETTLASYYHTVRISRNESLA